jgi:hypothetical protein
MKATELHYKVVNRDWNQSLEPVFSTFQAAWDALNKWDKDASIECISDEGVEVVWSRDFGDVESEDAFWLNSNMTGYQTLTLVESN